MTFSDLIIILRNTFQTPAGAMRQLQALELPISARWMALLLAVSLSTLLSAIVVGLYPQAAHPVLGILMVQPVVFALLQLGGTTIGAGLLALLGRAFGGRGNFADSLLLVAWVELLFLVIQAVQVLLLLILPPLSSLLGVVAMIAMIWVMVRMVQELHGFSNAVLVLLGLIFGTFLAVLILSVLAAALGFMPDLPPEMLQ
ncbi:MAG: Yip1 family protein [Paracoccus sp. (in: a-proteobacteria)]